MNTTATYHHGNLKAAILQRAMQTIDTSGIEALTLRGLARDLGVSHGAPNKHFANKAALLSALATEGWMQMKQATLSAAEDTGSSDPNIRLNAMARGCLQWALENPAAFRTTFHPDVTRFADDALKQAIEDFADSLRAEVIAASEAGRLQALPIPINSLFTNAVPIGAAMLLLNPILSADQSKLRAFEQQELIERVIDLVVPVGRGSE